MTALCQIIDKRQRARSNLSGPARMLDVRIAERNVGFLLSVLRNRDLSPNIIFPEPSEFNVAVLLGLRIHGAWQHLRLSICALPIFDGAHYLMEAALPLQALRAES